jgi:hypothetical protein
LSQREFAPEGKTVQRFVIALRKISVGSVLAAAIAATSAAAQTTKDRNCVYPNPYTLLGRDDVPLERVDYLQSDGMRWLFLSWEGFPADGMAFVLACDGHIIAKREVGNVTQYGWEGQDRVSPGVGVGVTTAAMTSKGILVSTESWLEFNGRTIDLLWTHPTLVANKPDGADIYQWTYLPPKNEIIVTGKHRRNPSNDAGGVALPEEKYCFHANANQFVRC